MAEKIVSPGVFTRENDQSFLSQGIGEIGAAIIGPFAKGPAFVPTVVNTQSEFESIFGTPDGSYYTGYAVQNYLREAGTVTIVRVGHIGGYTQRGTVGIKVSGSNGEKLVGVLKSTHHWTTSGNGDAITASIDAQESSSAFSITLSGSDSAYNTEISASILYTAGNDLSDVFGGNPRGSKGVYVSQFFENAAISTFNISSGSEVSLVSLGEQSFVDQDCSYASTPWIISQEISGETHQLFRFHTIGDGTYANTEYKISIFNIKAAGESNATDYATFSIVIRGYSDTDRRKSILETYNNVNLDPLSPNYILKVIGDQNITIDENGKMTMNGDYTNRSRLVRVEVSEEGSFPVTAGPFGHQPYYSPIRGLDSITPAVVFSTGSADNNASSTFRYSGIDLETAVVRVDNNYFLAPIPNNASTGSNTSFTFDNAPFNYLLTGSNTTDVAKRQFTVAFQGGFDGVSPTIKHALAKNNDTEWGSGNSQGFNLANPTTSGSIAYVKAINAVSNPDDFDINLVAAPGVVRRLHSYVFDKIVDMVEAREDAFYIGELSDYDDSIDLVTLEAQNVDSNYVGAYYPWVKTIDSRTNKLTIVPPSVLMPGIYAANDAIAAEWFAPAGLNRGGITGAVSVLNLVKRDN